MAMGIALAYLMKRFYFRYDWRNPSMATTRLAAVAGALSFMIFLAFIPGLQMPGMSIVALATIAGLLLLRRKIRMEAR
jgi:predicted acyltransferase